VSYLYSCQGVKDYLISTKSALACPISAYSAADSIASIFRPEYSLRSIYSGLLTLYYLVLVEYNGLKPFLLDCNSNVLSLTLKPRD